MSGLGRREVRCPHCARTFEAPAYTSLHMRRGEEVREAILAGEFERVPCDHCGASVAIERTMLYTDFERYHLFALLPRAAIVHRSPIVAHCDRLFRRNLDIAAPPAVLAWGPRFVRRVVFGLPHLKEKLLCDQYGIDDRALEALKLWLLRDLAPTWIDWRADVVLERVEGEDLVLTLTGPPELNDRTELVRVEAVPRSALAQVASAGAGFADSSGLLVDWRASFAPDEDLVAPFVDVQQQALYELLPPG